MSGCKVSPNGRGKNNRKRGETLRRKIQPKAGQFALTGSHMRYPPINIAPSAI